MDVQALKMRADAFNKRADASDRRADASDKRTEDIQKELADLSKIVDTLRQASNGYRIVRNRFLETFKRTVLPMKGLTNKINVMNKMVHIIYDSP